MHFVSLPTFNSKHMNKLSNTTRILLGITTLSLVVTYFVPLWQILLWAPQYPEGLTMKIWVNKLSGEVDIINGLNHYIGMKHISVEMFPEIGRASCRERV